ncbi:MAG: NADH:ubiquinone reductase (Na(+)-transporting) subunit B [Bacteroidetes bacterium]|jgi:Na+-transporting NADH:ubiquinone oxidoreductase subunit B|nr:NADH:ubiquinone reductase (Na(+)-transporting) subunit B [Bacteroidota bacterium]MBT6687433.1 NADH:ubiquinone reductase (Na(+)-transporting) subunit B [Bacteroidota bacterium]MBT7142301.1 NADH:ubiquinone reductase (Na(+)-transporting) subunit B [Bacteroidota bacterium]MBT7493354.1 NADH:ubiquinone reductase (Na(+)-transporting) subunit B [Bacteroidota bacterium]
MDSFRKYLDKIKPNYEKGGKYEKWLPVFESFETFLYVLGDVTKKGSHIRDAMDMKRTMSMVVIALIPALLFGCWNVGAWHFASLGEESSLFQNFWYGFLEVLPIIVVSYVVGLGTEFIFVFIKGHEIEEGFLVSGLLIPLIVPIDTPLWMIAVATIFAVVIGKEVFGGTGMNIVNPALTARAFLFFAYPSKMSGDKIWVSGLEKGEGVVDGFSGATPLAEAAAATESIQLSTSDMFFGFIPGSIGETSTLAILLGAVFLLYTGIASWKIMLSVFVGGSVMGLLFNAFAVNPFMEIPFYQHLFLGGFAFGAVFMATDPVTAAQTEKGKYIYGFLIGFIAVIVRVLNPAYPEGMMLAILLMNVFAPLIDHYIVRGNVKKRLKRLKI